MTAGFRLEVLGQAAADLVEDQAPDQRLGAVDVGRRHDKIERRRVPSTPDVANPPIAASASPRRQRDRDRGRGTTWRSTARPSARCPTC